MSKFGSRKVHAPPERLTILVNHTIKPKAPQRKAFSATSKSLAKSHHLNSFGLPTSPSRAQYQGDSFSSLLPDDGDHTTKIVEKEGISVSHLHLMKRQSARWINLSTTLWSLIVLDSKRTVTADGISQFLDVMGWRAHGGINEEEFSVLFSEWMALSGGGGSGTGEGGGSSSTRGGGGGAGVGSHPRNKRRNAVGVFMLRQLLLEKKIVEFDLDLFIGMIVHETNMRMLNFSVRYTPHSLLASTSSSSSSSAVSPLEVCTTRWLSLAEELFFSLDTAGFGLLRFDEVFFLCACLTIGIQGWNSEQEMEADVSLITLTATALQFFIDAGSNITLNSHKMRVVHLNHSGGGGQHYHNHNHHYVHSGGGGSGNGRYHGEMLDEMDFEMSRAQLSEVSKSLGFSPSKSAAASSSGGGGGGGGDMMATGSANSNINNNGSPLNYNSSYNHHGNSVTGKQHERSLSSKYAITITMFKKYLLKRNVGEQSLLILLNHVRTCVEKLSRVCHSEGGDNEDTMSLWASLSPFDESAAFGNAGDDDFADMSPGGGNRGVVTAGNVSGTGSPRLWQQAVLSASGIASAIYGDSRRRNRGEEGEESGTSKRGAGVGSAMSSSISSVPPIVKFLLSDGEKLISGNFRAAPGEQFYEESPLSGIAASTSASYGSTGDATATISNVLHGSQFDLHELAHRLWSYFCLWGESGNNSNNQGRANHQHHHSGNGGGGSGNGVTGTGIGAFGLLSGAALAHIVRDPVYQLVLNSLLEYKQLQATLNAALMDTITSYFGLNRGFAPSVPLLCASLIPSPKMLMKDLGGSSLPDVLSSASMDQLPQQQQQQMESMGLISDSLSRSASDGNGRGAGAGHTPVVKFSLSELDGGSNHSPQQQQQQYKHHPQSSSSSPLSPSIRRSSSRDSNVASASSSSSSPALTAEQQQQQHQHLAHMRIPPHALPDHGDSIVASVDRTPMSPKEASTAHLVSKMASAHSPVERKRILGEFENRNGHLFGEEEEKDEDDIDVAVANAEWMPLFDARVAPKKSTASASPEKKKTSAKESAAPIDDNEANNNSMTEEEAKLFSEMLREPDKVKQLGLMEQLRRMRTPAAVSAPARDNQVNGSADDDDDDEEEDAEEMKKYHRNNNNSRGSSSRRQQRPPPVDSSDSEAFVDRRACISPSPSPYNSADQSQGVTNSATAAAAAAATSAASAKSRRSVTTKPAAATTATHSEQNGFRKTLNETHIDMHPASLSDTPALVQHLRFNSGDNMNDDTNNNRDSSRRIAPQELGADDDEEEDDDDEEASTVISHPNSIEEMLRQGQDVGKYAGMLREILRKMSKDDSKVQLKSLQQVLQLGQELVTESDNQKKKVMFNTGNGNGNGNNNDNDNGQGGNHNIGRSNNVRRSPAGAATQEHQHHRVAAALRSPPPANVGHNQQFTPNSSSAGSGLDSINNNNNNTNNTNTNTSKWGSGDVPKFGRYYSPKSAYAVTASPPPVGSTRSERMHNNNNNNGGNNSTTNLNNHNKTPISSHQAPSTRQTGSAVSPNTQYHASIHSITRSTRGVPGSTPGSSSGRRRETKKTAFGHPID